MFSFQIKTQSQRFQIPRVWTVFTFEERRFRGKLWLWTEDLAVEIKLRFQISQE